MPFRGLLSGLLGNQSNGQEQAQPGAMIRSPDSDSYQIIQQGQSQQISNSVAVQHARAAIHEMERQRSTQDDSMLYGDISRRYREILNTYHTPFEYDLSDKTTLAMCEIVKKATEKLWLK